MEFTQTGRLLSVTSPLGTDALLLESFTGAESLSQLFELRLSLLSEMESAVPSDIVGKDVAIVINGDSGPLRVFIEPRAALHTRATEQEGVPPLLAGPLAKGRGAAGGGADEERERACRLHRTPRSTPSGPRLVPLEFLFPRTSRPRGSLSVSVTSARLETARTSS